MNASRKSRQRRSSESGYTLIEVILAVTLLSLVLGTALLATRLYMDGRNRGRNEISRRWREYRNLAGLRSVLRGVYDYHVQWPAKGLDKKGPIRPFFIAGSNECEFVTFCPLMTAEHLALGHLFLRREDDHRSRLVYQEVGLDDDIIKEGEQLPPYTHEIELLDDIQQLDFRYFGVQGYRWNENALRREPVFGWSREYRGRDRNMIPELIEIGVVYRGGLGRETLQFRLADNNFAKKRFVTGRHNRE